VNRIGRGFIMRMAVRATETVVVRRVEMAIGAGGPDVGVGPGVDREPGVIEGCSRPRGGVVALCTRGRKPGCDVIWILYPCVVGFMARVAVCGHGGVIAADVAGRTGHADVGARKREGRLRMVEGCGGPVRGAVAKGAIQGESRLRMIRIVGPVNP